MPNRYNLRWLRGFAARRSLFAPTDLMQAIRTLGFVQMDPIRAPARAQDLILRHRVADYRNGDLDRRYAELPLIEDYVHVYGVLPAESRRLLHPRQIDSVFRVEKEFPDLQKRVHAHVRGHGATHPRDLRVAIGGSRMINAWGGNSAATTRALDLLHYRGVLRVSHRATGIRVYDVAARAARALAPMTRAIGLIKLLLRLYAPMTETAVRSLATSIDTGSLPVALRGKAIDRVIKSDWVARATVDGSVHFWPADDESNPEADENARLLAPFDPIVWDRQRFEQLWNWAYRFEAYTPASKRKLGYYALPLLWRDAVIGWANVRRKPAPGLTSKLKSSRLDVELGFVTKRPSGIAFERELDAEVARFDAFLSPR